MSCAHKQMNKNYPQISFFLRSATKGCMWATKGCMCLRSLFTLEEYFCPGIHYSTGHGRYSLTMFALFLFCLNMATNSPEFPRIKTLFRVNSR